ncbi:hypothetical protein ABE525_12000 [Pseudomonas wadenswilerensis]|uniref:hypothetical protein n=1 Tax=Pseudomonas wadenswilerensis TaxID=1785161 RepID=UPI0032093FEE
MKGDIVFWSEDGSEYQRITSGESKDFSFQVGVEYEVEFLSVLTDLTVINLMDDVNYWVTQLEVDTLSTSTEALTYALMSSMNGDKILTLGGVRQESDETHGIHYTSIGALAFLNDKTSAAAAKPFSSAMDKVYFATACSLAVTPSQRQGWSNNNNGNVFNDSHVTPMPLGNESLATFGVGSHGYIVAQWDSDPRPQWSVDWTSVLIDIMFSRKGGTDMKP